ncbi:16S rRNA (cytosine(1402)-N(4))-methyltransferase RsmH [Candidatus Gracilibacteria bacterium]|nr:16S rRNA (cytosine(1402)-N(4))-methyltransferase RsmH [Candidatus Gracilibacteria bacterium]
MKLFYTSCAQLLHIVSKIVQTMPLIDLVHEPVLKKEVIGVLMSKKIKTVFDGTLGLGGHAKLILENFPQLEKYIGVELDMQHLDFAQKKLKKWHKKTVFKNQNFSEIKEILQTVGFFRPLVVLLDLGICSNQVDNGEKGFSFMQDGPLNMAFDKKNNGKCSEIINKFSENALSDIFKKWGEEPMHSSLARKIVEGRKQKKIETTMELKSIIEANVPSYKVKKILMRIFQALRIATNDELWHLEKVLHETVNLLELGDRFGVMSFHSLEDRMVKHFFRKKTEPKTEETVFSLHTQTEPAEFRLLSKKPIVPSQVEQEENSRSRSVKFRIIEKI